MRKKVHRGSNGTPNCSRSHKGSINRNTRAVTMTDEEFAKAPDEFRCQTCVRALARKTADTTSFAKGLSAFLGLK